MRGGDEEREREEKREQRARARATAARGGPGTAPGGTAHPGIRSAEDFEAPIYKASQLSMDTAADLEIERKANAVKARLAQRRRANVNAPPVFEWRYEGVGIAVVVAYVLNYIRGNAANRNIARAFGEAFLSCDASDGDGVTSATSVTSVTRASLSHPTAAPCSEPSSRRLVSWRRRTRRIRPTRARVAARLSREAPDEYRCWATGRRF